MPIYKGAWLYTPMTKTSSAYAKARSTLWLRRYRKLVQQAANLEAQLGPALRDEDIAVRFKALAGKPLKERTAEGLALYRMACERALGMRPYDVQLVGAAVLLEGKLAEMRTGEGKTLTVVGPAALHALEGKGVHVVTANPYLAERDAQSMRAVYELLGLRVAFITDTQSVEEKQAAYLADVTYGVGSEFGFDYLKDNLVKDAAKRVQRGRFCAIVDEVDAVLIDDARTPLIISEQDDSQVELVLFAEEAVRALDPARHVVVNLKELTATLNEEGYALAEQALVNIGALQPGANLYAVENLPLAQALHAAVKAHALYKKDRDFVVAQGRLALVDQSTGRLMTDRRLSDGLHEALEAMAGLPVAASTLTKASITFQSYYRMYERLSGLTGTALTEAEELTEFYGLETVVVPTHRPVIRQEFEDRVYLRKSDKFSAVAEEVANRHAKGQPILVGVATVRDAEVVSALLHQRGLGHEVLSAKYLAKEAAIIANAGVPGAITVATNMAGRGTDIMLGGAKPEKGEDLSAWQARRDAAVQAGGLFVLGTERNGLRRVDNQLVGRCGRQGEPGQTQFFLSLEDELLRVFSTSPALGAMRALLADGASVGGKQVSRMVATAQSRYEEQGFDARRELMKFDEALVKQRRVVYSFRDALLDPEQQMAFVRSLADRALESWIDGLPYDQELDDWDIAALRANYREVLGAPPALIKLIHQEDLSLKEILERIRDHAKEHLGKLQVVSAEKAEALLKAVDILWTLHLGAMEQLKQGANLKTPNGMTPLFLYEKDAFSLFEHFQDELARSVGQIMFGEVPAASTASREEALRKVAAALAVRLPLRTEACPCGSGKLFKDCHGRLAGRSLRPFTRLL